MRVCAEEIILRPGQSVEPHCVQQPASAADFTMAERSAAACEATCQNIIATVSNNKKAITTKNGHTIKSKAMIIMVVAISL